MTAALKTARPVQAVQAERPSLHASLLSAKPHKQWICADRAGCASPTHAGVREYMRRHTGHQPKTIARARDYSAYTACTEG